MQKYKVWFLALALIAAGGALLIYKWRDLGYPLLPDEQTRIWTVEVMLRFDAGENPAPVKANLHIPALTPSYAILDENFVSRGFGFTTRYVSGGRQAQWTIRRVRGLQTLYYRAVVYRDPARAESDTTPPFPPIPDLGEPMNTALQEIVEQVRGQSVDPATFTVALLQRLNRSGGDQNTELLLGPKPDALSRARTAITVLAAAQVPARLIRGIPDRPRAAGRRRAVARGARR